MSDREKLIELLNHSFDEQYNKLRLLNAQFTADYLISNGVTVQKWIPVSERLPKLETDVLVVSGGNVSILAYRYNRRGDARFMYMDDCGYWKECFAPRITHWMPLPEPPKE